MPPSARLLPSPCATPMPHGLPGHRRHRRLGGCHSAVATGPVRSTRGSAGGAVRRDPPVAELARRAGDHARPRDATRRVVRARRTRDPPRARVRRAAGSPLVDCARAGAGHARPPRERLSARGRSSVPNGSGRVRPACDRHRLVGGARRRDARSRTHQTRRRGRGRAGDGRCGLAEHAGKRDPERRDRSRRLGRRARRADPPARLRARRGAHHGERTLVRRPRCARHPWLERAHVRKPADRVHVSGMRRQPVGARERRPRPLQLPRRALVHAGCARVRNGGDAESALWTALRSLEESAASIVACKSVPTSNTCRRSRAATARRPTRRTRVPRSSGARSSTTWLHRRRPTSCRQAPKTARSEGRRTLTTFATLDRTRADVVVQW